MPVACCSAVGRCLPQSPQRVRGEVGAGVPGPVVPRPDAHVVGPEHGPEPVVDALVPDRDQGGPQSLDAVGVRREPALEVVVTDTLPVPPEHQFENLTVLSIAPLIARAIQEVFEDGSVTSLFDGRS